MISLSRVCNANGPGGICRDAYEAAAIGGSLRYDHSLGGWVDETLPVRVLSWRARYYRPDAPLADHSGEPWLLEHCPHCGGELPTAVPKPPAREPWRQADGEGDE